MRARISLVVAVVVGCGAGPSSDSASNAWQCHDVAIAHGHETVCQSSSAGSGGSYTCEPVSGGATSGGGTLQPHGTTDGQLTSSGGATSSSSGNTSDGTPPSASSSSSSSGDDSSPSASDGPQCPPGTVPVPTSGGNAGPNGAPGGNGADDSSNPSGNTGDGESGPGGSKGKGGSSGPSGSTNDGSGWQCSSSGGQTTCTSPPSCDSGYHAACGTCVADGSSDSCGTNGGSNVGCTLTQGYWKNHASAWPVQSLTLGGTTYSQAELLTILGTAPGGDASLVLAHQLIATLLSTDAGASAGPIAGVIAQAQAWLSANGKTLPYGVSSSSAAGAQAVALANQLDAYNNGMAGVPHCN